jgi:DNA-binding response OmpR family regulator
MCARILLVEDDDDLRDVLAGALLAEGHDVRAVPDGEAALDALAAERHELVLLDLGLGPRGPDGIGVCRRLRASDIEPFVMVLTARGEEADIVLALEAGADDYVRKPVGIAELRSRVRAALRRLSVPPGATVGSGGLRSGALELDADARTVHWEGAELRLTPSEFAVLHALMHAAGGVRSRVELVRAIFGDDAFRDPRAIDVHVHHLREKLTEAGGDPAAIATVRGAGYRLAA